MSNHVAKMTRIGVFYDGNYFLHVSNYYNYEHIRRKRLSISGLHQFLRHHVADQEGSDVSLCQIVDAHYFRGRISAQEASQRGDALYWDRVFDDILMSAGVTTHYLPLRNAYDRRVEKGIDVLLALECYELTVFKKFDVIVLIASDGDYVPLIRKLNTLGTRVMVLSWDFEYTTEVGKRLVTRTSQELLEEVSYPVAMHEVIDNRIKRNDPVINNIFVQHDSRRKMMEEWSDLPVNEAIGDMKTGEVFSIKSGYGFIKYPPNNLFFHHTSVVDGDFNELREGDIVEYTTARNDDGNIIAQNVRQISPAYAQ